MAFFTFQYLAFFCTMLSVLSQNTVILFTLFTVIKVVIWIVNISLSFCILKLGFIFFRLTIKIDQSDGISRLSENAHVSSSFSYFLQAYFHFLGAYLFLFFLCQTLFQQVCSSIQSIDVPPKK